MTKKSFTHLTTNFTLEEMTHSQTAVRKGYANDPSPTAVERLRQLCKLILEPLRKELRKPIIISSGFRGREVNSAIGGAVNSQHMKGEAADIMVPGFPPQIVFETIIKLKLPYDQVIQEFDQWVHVSHAPEYNRSQELTATKVGRRTVYMPFTIEG